MIAILAGEFRAQQGKRRATQGEVQTVESDGHWLVIILAQKVGDKRDQ